MKQNIPLPIAGNIFVQDLALAQLNGRDAKSFVTWLLAYWHLVSPDQRHAIVAGIKKRQADQGLIGCSYRGFGRYGYWEDVVSRQAEPEYLDQGLFEDKTDTVAVARALAVWAHDGAGQRYAGLPYSVHLTAVAKLAAHYAYLLPADERVDAVAAAWLHDVIEDGYYSRNDLAPRVGLVAATTAQLCVSSTGATRSERHDAAYHARVSSSTLAVFVKLCDRLANVNYGGPTMLKYRKEEANFEQGLRVATHHPILIPLLEDLQEALEQARLLELHAGSTLIDHFVLGETPAPKG